MIVLGILAAVVFGVAAVSREMRIYRQNREVRAVPVQLVSAAGRSSVVGTLAFAALLVAAGLVVMHTTSAPDTTSGPTTPLGGDPSITAPAVPAGAAVHTTSSTSPAPVGRH